MFNHDLDFSNEVLHEVLPQVALELQQVKVKRTKKGLLYYQLNLNYS